MNLIEMSQALVKENNDLEDRNKRFEAYMFSSKIRPIIFGYTFGESRDKTLNKLIITTQELIQDTRKLKVKLQFYHEQIKNADMFIQQKHSRYAKKLSYNTTRRAKKIIRYYENILEQLEEIKTKQERYQKIFHTIKKQFTKAKHQYERNTIAIGDITGRFQIENKLVKKDADIVKNLIEKSDLETGDLLVSFKSNSFLKKVLISRAISKITRSQVTHVLLAAKLSGNNIRIVDSHGETGGVTMRDFELLPGEVFIVLRPKISGLKRTKLLQTIRKYVKSKAKYSKSELKGVLPSLIINRIINMFTFGYVATPNIINHINFFCSEFINQVFKEVGFLLTAKSEYSNMVFPGDIVTSPNVAFVGLIFEDSEKNEQVVVNHFKNIEI